jgi:hypothetical protein
VGHPNPGDSARNIASLLQAGPEKANGARYASFVEDTLSISVDTDRPQVLPPRSLAGEDTGFTYNCMAQITPSEAERRYRTIRLTGSRQHADLGKDIQVDVYEMYWADLSSTSRRFMRFLQDLYQFLFHLASLGRKTVLAAERSSKPGCARGFLRLLALCHRSIELLLPTAIPVANLFLLVPIFVLSVLFIPPEGRALVFAGCAAASVFFATCAVAYRMAKPVGGILAVAAAAASGSLAMRIELDHQSVLCGYLAAIAGLCLSYYASTVLLDRYTRKVKILVPFVAAAFMLLLFGFSIELAGDPNTDAPTRMLVSAAWIAHSVFWLLQLMWAAAFVLFAGAYFLPMVARIARLTPDHRAMARTGRIGVLLSATLFFLVTVLLWATILDQISQHLHNSEDLAKTALNLPPYPVLLYSENPMFAACGSFEKSRLLLDYMNCLFSLTTGANINAVLVIFALTVFLAGACILPSAWYEAKPISGANALQPARVRRLKAWLDAGGRTLLFAEMIALLAWIWLCLGYLRPSGIIDTRNNWMGTAGALIAAALPVTIAFRFALPKAATTVLDIALDVSNWLQERPYSRNPRGRILFRYLALLREVSESRNYDRIVIVSHSQGTVITADLLRLIHQLRYWPGNKRPRPEIALLTAGSPLRQLYAARFPQWYGWAIAADTKSMGIKVWVNIFRSGDYVGRNLWDTDPVKPENLVWTCQPQDVLLGMGAHTHYFDGTAAETRMIIDWMIEGPQGSIPNTEDHSNLAFPDTENVKP